MATGENWIIKGQVTKKGKKIQYQNGFLFKIDLIDEDGTQIEGTFYKDCADKFFDKVEEGKIYIITKGEVASANKKFTSI
jgi:replication factor A1